MVSIGQFLPNRRTLKGCNWPRAGGNFMPPVTVNPQPSIIASIREADAAARENSGGARELSCCTCSIAQMCPALTQPGLLIRLGESIQVPRGDARVIHPLAQERTAVDHIDGKLA